MKRKEKKKEVNQTLFQNYTLPHDISKTLLLGCNRWVPVEAFLPPFVSDLFSAKGQSSLKPILKSANLLLCGK